MILVDTSTMIDALRGRDNPKTRLFSEVLRRDIPFGISAFTYQELLQGAKDDAEFSKLDEYLSSQQIYILPANVETFRKAAEIFYSLRRRGVTIRSTIDVMIAMTAMEYKLSLLHNDRDFDVMARFLDSLIILEQI